MALRDGNNMIDRVLARAHRRAAAAMALLNVGRALTIVGVAALLGVVVLRLTGVDADWSLVVALTAGAIGIGAAPAVLRRRQPLDDAIRLDHALQLKDSLGTATSIGHSRGPFEALIVADAARRAQHVDWKRAIPVRIPATIWIGALVCGGAIGAAMLVPLRATVPSEQDRIALAQQQRRQEAAEQLADASSAIRNSETPDAVSSEQAKAERDKVVSTLDRLSEQLNPTGNLGAQGSSSTNQDDVDSQIAGAADQLTDMADELDRQAAMRQRTADSLRDTLQKLAQSGKGDSSAQSLIDALSRGEFERSADEIEALKRQADSMSPEDRQRAAEHLAQAAKAIRDEQAAREKQVAQQKESDYQALDSQGIDEQTRQDWEQNPPSQEELSEQLRKQGADPADAQRLARQWKDRLDEHKAQENANDESRRIADGLDELAKDLNEPPPSDQTDRTSEAGGRDSQTPSESQSPSQQEPGESSDGQSESQPASQGDSKPDPDASGQTQKNEPSEQTQQTQEPGSEPGQTTPGQNAVETKEVQPGAQEKPGNEVQPPGGQDNEPKPGRIGQEDKTGAKPGEEGQRPPVDNGADRKQPDQPGQGEPMVEPGAPTNDTTGEKPPQGSEQPDVNGEPGAAQPDQLPDRISDEDLERVLRTIDKYGKEAQGHREVSEELRRQAEELAKRLTPEQREQIERWARQRQKQQQGEPPAPGRDGSERQDTLPGGQTQGSSPGGMKRGPALEAPAQGDSTGLADVQTDDRLLKPGDGDKPWEYEVIEDWYPPQGQDEGDDQSTTGGADAGAPVIRRAAQATERALDEQRIGARYRELIKRWANRWQKQAEETKPDQ